MLQIGDHFMHFQRLICLVVCGCEYAYPMTVSMDGKGSSCRLSSIAVVGGVVESEQLFVVQASRSLLQNLGKVTECAHFVADDGPLGPQRLVRLADFSPLAGSVKPRSDLPSLLRAWVIKLCSRSGEARHTKR